MMVLKTALGRLAAGAGLMGGTLLCCAAAWAADDAHAEDAAHHEGIPVELWLILALVVLIAIAFKPARKAITEGLDGRAAGIRKELDEAQRLREEAKIALANIQRKHRAAMEEAEQIKTHAKEEAKRMVEHAKADLAESLKRREAATYERLAQAEARAIAEVRATAVEAAVRATSDIIAKKLDGKGHERLIDQAIEDLPQRLN